MVKKERVQWVDVAKGIGIFLIYLGHFGESAGRSTPFVFTFHVALFFFLSGCMNYYDHEERIIPYIIKRFKMIMLPFFTFSFIALILYSIMNSSSIMDIYNMIINIFMGDIRNTFIPAGSLWFLSCLFVIEIIFKLLKATKSKLLILDCCILLFIISSQIISPHPLVEPHLIYNIDSAMYFILFFSLGYIVYPYILDLFILDKSWKKIVVIITFILSIGYSFFLFFGRNILSSILGDIPVISYFVPVFTSLIPIWMILVISKCCENIKVLNDIGRETLYLCCNEDIIKMSFVCLFETISLKLSLNSPLHVYIYSFMLIYIVTKFIAPYEKYLKNNIHLIKKD